MTSHHATCVSIAERGLLIEGPSGSGKSSLALALIERGALLVADDTVLLEARGGELLAQPHSRTSGLLEVRNLGLLTFPYRDEAAIALIVKLDDTAPRFVEQAETAERAGIVVPLIRLWPHSPVLALRAELALDLFGRG